MRTVCKQYRLQSNQSASRYRFAVHIRTLAFLIAFNFRLGQSELFAIVQMEICFSNDMFNDGCRLIRDRCINYMTEVFAVCGMFTILMSSIVLALYAARALARANWICSMSDLSCT